MRRYWSTLALLAIVALPGSWLGGGPSRAAPAGTLDQLLADFDLRLDEALRRRTSSDRLLRKQDLALRLLAGAGVSERLSQAVLRLLKGKLSSKGLRSYGEIEESTRAALEKRARADGFELLLDLELLLVQGQLHLQGDLVATDRSLWRDTKSPDRGALSHLHASVRADAEVRAFQGSLGSTATRFAHQSFPYGRQEALALGAGDLDGDGRAELVLLTSRAVVVLRYKSSGFTQLCSAELSGALATVRPRRALGTLIVHDLDGDKRAEVLARSSDFEEGQELAFDGKELNPRRQFQGYPLLLENVGGARGWLVAGASSPGQDLLSASLLRRLPLERPRAGASRPPEEPREAEWQQGQATSLYALRGARVPGPRARSYVASIDSTGQLSLFAEGSRTALLNLARVGVAADLCDLDDDGKLEVITTGADGPDGEDQINVQRLVQPASGGPQLRSLWRSPPLGGQVTALAHGDLDGTGKLKLVAAVRQRGQLMLMVIQ